MYMQQKGIQIPVNELTGKPATDTIFPMLAIEHLGVFASFVFIVGLTAATFSSADSVLTTLTTSFCIDFLGFENKTDEKLKVKQRHYTHIGFAVLLFITILLCKYLNKTFILDAIFSVAAYTYGPLLGLFTFGLFTKINVKDKWVPVVCVIAPLLSYVLNENSVTWFNGYKFSYELLVVNGFFTFLGLYLIKRKNEA
jgi:Na+/pantothenate symporter